jgi:hypothetical protein
MKGKELTSKRIKDTKTKSKIKGESIKVKESTGNGRLKVQNSATPNDYVNSVNYESDGEEA